MAAWALTFAAAAATCVIGLFRPRADIERDTQETPVRPARWIEEMRSQKEADES